MGHLLITAAHKSSGKTTVSSGICAGLAARGLTVQPFKKGPDFIDPKWLALASGRNCYNLDFFTMGAEEIRQLFAARSAGADLALIEGNKGLYDGLDLHGSNSNAALAMLLGTPVILVIDARGMTRGIAPLILGYQAFDRQINIAGVILNKLGGSRHESKLREVIEHYTDVPVIGAVHRRHELSIVERHLGLIPCEELAESKQQTDLMGDCVASQVDLDRLVGIARDAVPVLRTAGNGPLLAPSAPDVSIGVARDTAFGFYYPDDLEALRAAGAQLVYFDATSDPRLPDVDGLFIGGGFPEMNADALEANSGLRAQIREFVDAGGPVYAECGGLMYLGRSIERSGRRFEMVGGLPFDSFMMAVPVGRGYVHLSETGASPWPGASPAVVPAHEFHYARSELFAEPDGFAYRVKRGYGFDGERDGIVYKNTLASYTHLRNTREYPWAARFVTHVRNCTRVNTAGTSLTHGVHGN